ncbi:hypothetical protein BGZ96_003433 [Linnemannia gamsii]|uniref:Uncharacterized protein n=1 Tax=Linnemannia gamsii TaxID=64522 RepID=A0ABQ7JJ74_9FUNG|nr:hypothetical protein BGZ96_003433 [Linnemannia gamsii]
MKFTSTSTLALIATTTLTYLSSFAKAQVTLDQCSISLLGLVGDPGLNACLPMQQLSLLVTTSPITPLLVNNTATSLCSLPVCPQSSITLVQNTVSQNCVNASDPATADLILSAASLYAPFRDGMCQRIPGGNGTFCVTELAETMTAYLAKHPSPLGIKIFANSTVLKQYFDEMPQEILCTPCNKAIINPIENYITANKATLSPQVLQWATILQTEATNKCGAAFTDGQKATSTPAGPKPTAGAAGGNSGAEELKVMGGGGSMAALVVAVVGALLL